MRLQTLTALALAAAGLVGVACQGGGERQTVDEAGPVRLVEGERSDPVPENVKVRFDAPPPGSVSPDSVVEAGIDVQGFTLEDTTPAVDRRGIAISERGTHVHFMVDNSPYVAVYDENEVLELTGLETGAHWLRAFAARQWHESVKTDSAFAMRKFYVNDTLPDLDVQRDDPLLTYSRPKGLYRGQAADSILVDFFVTNAELGPDAHSVRLTVDDSLVYSLDEWKPHYLLGLDSGEHAVKLDLIGPKGSVVPGAFNTTERVITVVRDTVAEGPMER